MNRYLGNNVVLGNLFEKVAKQEIDSITFNKLYDILYYASIQLEKKETIFLVDRDGIFNFINIYRDFIYVDETDDVIKILNKEKVALFSQIYQIDKTIEDVFTKAIEMAFAA